MAGRRLDADITIRAPNGRLVGAVEVKNRMALSPEISVDYRHTMTVYSDLSGVEYFLLVSQDVGYAWHQRGELLPLAEPDAAFDMSAVVTQYDGKHDPLDRLRGFQLTAVMYRWLLDLTDGVSHPDREAELALAEIGFLDAVHGATIELESAFDSVR